MEEAEALVRDGLVAVDAARRDHAERRRLVLHHADLHGRGVGAEEDAAGRRVVGAGRAAGGGVRALDPERVLHVARRVLGAEVERGEVGPVGLDLGAGGRLEAHAVEDALGGAERLAQRVDRALGGEHAARQREVEVGLAAAAARGGEGLLRDREALFGRRAERVEALPERAAVLGGRVAHLAEEVRHGAGLAAEHLDAEGLHLRVGVERGGFDLAVELGDLVVERHGRAWGSGPGEDRGEGMPKRPPGAGAGRASSRRALGDAERGATRRPWRARRRGQRRSGRERRCRRAPSG